MNNNSDRVE